MRSKTTQITNRDGSISRVISIGVPRDHPFADLETNPGSGLHNIRVGRIRLPNPPTFVVREMAEDGQGVSREDYNHIRQTVGIPDDQRIVQIDYQPGVPFDHSLVDNQV